MLNGRCAMHGGKTPRGVDSPHTKHGRYSKDLPTRLAGRFEQAIKDAELIQLNREAALLDTRIGELLEQIDAEGTGAIFKLLAKAWTDYRAAKEGDKPTSLMVVEQLIERGMAQEITWAEIYSLIEQRRKVVESEAKRQTQLKQTLTVSQAMTLLTAVVDIVKRNVSDDDILRSVSRDISGLLARGAGAAA